MKTSRTLARAISVITRTFARTHSRRLLGAYRLERKIGGGGMGIVWRANHVSLKRCAAVKVLLPDRMDRPALRRFEREVQLAAQVAHPNVVTIYDYGRGDDGEVYYAMELLDGLDLETLVFRHGPLPPARVVHLLAQICGALASAHDLGLVHRDVKPSNVMVSPKNDVEPEVAKLVDFGLVKRVRVDVFDAALTSANTITGSPMYMAPEAIKVPNAVDARSDLYALGALGWFLLAGRAPFDGGLIEVCSAHLHRRPARPSVVLGAPLPADLEAVLLACLEKRPADRPTDARTVRRMLEACACAGQWTEADASAFWSARPQRAWHAMHCSFDSMTSGGSFFGSTSL